MDIAALVNQALQLSNAGRVQEALPLLEKAAHHAPHSWQVLYNLANIRKSLGLWDAAVAAYGAAIKSAPKETAPRINLANTLRALGQLKAAEKEVVRAIALDPRDPIAFYCHATILAELRWYPKAEKAYREALARAPALADAHMGLARILLGQGRYDEGWKHYEWRWEKRSFDSPRRDFSVPQWQGESLKGKTILLHTEQGFGDALQFLRFVPAVVETGARVVLDVQKGLLRLVRDIPGVQEIVERGTAPVQPVDYHCPLMSLPGIFGTRVETIPFATGYLSASPDLVDGMSDIFQGRNRLRVGLVWFGNPQQINNPVRSPGLARMLPLMAADADFFGLQMGPGREELSAVSMPENFYDLGPHIRDMADTAALMMHLDVVVSPCTGPVHLAGALGVPSLVMLARYADWRWLENRSDSPWYAYARLIRQRREGEWESVVHEVKTILDRLVASKR